MGFALAVLLSIPARAQDSGAIGIADGRGGFYSVTNRQGRAGYFQITKLASNGGVLWNVPYDPGEDGRAAIAVLVAAHVSNERGHAAVRIDGSLPSARTFPWA